MNNREKELGTAPMGPLMVRLAIPAIAAQVVNMLYNIVDRMYIGRIPDIGADALTGVGVTFSMILLISAFAALAGMGGAPLASIQLGSGNKEEAERILGNATSMLLVTATVLTVVCTLLKEPFLYAFGASDAIIGYSLDYIGIYIYGTVFVQLALGLNTFISAQGNAVIAMSSVLVGAGLNIVLDPIFIFGFDMGVKGAAIATVISQAASAIWVVSFLCSKRSVIRIRKKNMRLNLPMVKRITSLGVAPFTMQATESLVYITLNSGLQKYGGDAYVGSMTIIQSVMQMTTMPINGITQGVQPILGYNYGAGNFKRVKEGFGLLIRVTMTATCCASAVVILFPEVLAGLFTDDAELIALVGKTMPIFFGGIWAFGAQMACQTTFMALGQAKTSFFLALLRKVILLVPLAIILPMVTGNVMAIYVAEPIADIIASGTTFTLFMMQRKKLLPDERLGE